MSDAEGNVSSNDDDVYEMDGIRDVRYHRRQLQYQIMWTNGYLTWEPEDCFIGEESKKILDDFRESQKEKIEALMNQARSKRSSKQSEEDEEDTKTDEELREVNGYDDNSIDDEYDEESGNLAPRELTEEDSFYGQKVRELRGESRRLFDPSHLQTTTDLLLAAHATEGRISRSKAAQLKKAASENGSGEQSRSETPLSRTSESKETPTKSRRGRKKKVEVIESPKKEDQEEEQQEVEEQNDESPKKRTTRRRGRPPTRKNPPRRGRPRKVKEQIDKEEDDEDEEEDEEDGENEDSVVKDTRENKKKKQEPDPEDVSENVKKNEKNLEDEEPEEPAEDPEEPEEPELKKRPVRQSRRKRILDVDVIDEPDEKSKISPKSSPPPAEKEKSTFFQGREDEEEVEKLFPVCQPNTVEVMQCLNDLAKNYEAKTENVIDAILNGDINTIRLIFKNEANREENWKKVVNYRDKVGRPLLQSLIQSIRTTQAGKQVAHLFAVIRCVIQNSKQFLFVLDDAYGNKAIHEAVKCRLLPIVRILANSGSLISPINNEGYAPIDLAALNGDIECFRFLLQRGATFHHLLSKRYVKPFRPVFTRFPDLNKELESTNSTIARELIRTRRKLFKKNFTEIRSCPVMVFPRHDNNVVSLSFEYKHGSLTGENQGYFLTMFPIAFNHTQQRWIVSLTNTMLDAAPQLNGTPLKHVQKIQLPSVFFAAPKTGINKVNVSLNNINWGKEMAIAVQLVRYEIRPPSARFDQNIPLNKPAPKEKRLVPPPIR